MSTVATVLNAPAIRDFELNDCDKVLFRELPTTLQRLKINEFRTNASVVDGSSGIRELILRSCLQLEIPSHLDCSALKSLELKGCDSLKSFPLDLFSKLRGIEISDCKHLESFTEGGLRAPDLCSLCIRNCGRLRSLPDNMGTLLPSLVSFCIDDCPEIESFSEGGFPCSLKTIDIRDCKKLFAKRMEWGLENHPSLTTVLISGKSEDVKSFPEAGLLPSNLVKLTLKNFENMKSLDKIALKRLISLGRLCLIGCPHLKRLPKDGLPETHSCIDIVGCPLLKKHLQNKKGKRRRQIPNAGIMIDGVPI